MVQPKRPASKRSVTLARGFRAAGGAFGIKPSGKPDMALIVADAPCAAAGVFTKNRCVGAPVTIGKKHLKNGVARAIIVNAGCSNVMTGQRGLDDAQAMCQAVADQIGCKPTHVLPASTGIIGHHLPMDAVLKGIQTLPGRLARGPRADQQAGAAILTTDLVAKSSRKSLTLGGKKVTVAGIAKGSGMIQPNMATMLSFITTDAAITPPLLRRALATATKHSFNRISVDHDTSTSDMVLVLASGASEASLIDRESEDFAALTQALTAVCQHLAEQVICDGEGASRVFAISIQNAWSEADADKIGYAVTGSPLVKTAVHGADPNWGRILAAAGRSGAKVRPEQTSLWIGRVCVLNNGNPARLTPPQQARLDQSMRAEHIDLRLDLGFPEQDTPICRWLGCDLSAGYVTINADYTT